ncbi:polyprenyl synthetase family protein [Pengzhenrongella frigida]|uniref:Polyprenyl synthetase family protein n=1 Tax=Pengzhenrongella frigida TaxID=1259133 RepID=A0A4Q5N1E0_9MICO|nr:polyprenyl synthetase family protein [Cellulomonas sp. HLT2-17]RYV50357.1 polyprenyl synthetase family protein [Cellulomonas sp. HLT2-17]
MPTLNAPVDVEDVRRRVDALLAEHIAEQRPVLACLGVDSAVLADAVAEMLSGGKRLRAAFCYWSWRAHGGRPDSPLAGAVLRVGAALELFQAAALFHDDVMDDSDTRRGHRTAHRTFEALHQRSGWTGDSRRFGEAAAILLGDLALVASDAEFNRALAEFPAEVGPVARRIFDRMRTEVTVGQYLDMLAQVLPWGMDPVADEARAREVIRAKSARYSVEHPLGLGAALAGADADTLASSSAFGLPLGEAFQLRDDLLGVFGDPATTGKPAGDDLREGKRTVLVARAMAAGDEAQRALLRERLGIRDLADDDVATVAAAIAATGAPDEVETLIAELSSRAFTALAAATLDEPGAEMLARLGHAAIDRRA